jgi:hypothetical protein
MTAPAPKPRPLPARCWNCGASRRACTARARAALAFGDLTPATARCCLACLHEAEGPLPRPSPDLPWFSRRRRRGRRARAAYRAWRAEQTTAAPQHTERR